MIKRKNTLFDRKKYYRSAEWMIFSKKKEKLAANKFFNDICKYCKIILIVVERQLKLFLTLKLTQKNQVKQQIRKIWLSILLLNLSRLRWSRGRNLQEEMDVLKMNAKSIFFKISSDKVDKKIEFRQNL